MRQHRKASSWGNVAEIWDRTAGESGMWHQQHTIDPVMLQLIGKAHGKLILEVGCGNAYFARLLARKGARVVATDISANMLACARRREQLKPAGITLLRQDAARLSGLQANRFDITVANMCFMDIAHARAAFREIARVLKNKGLLALSITHPLFSDFRQQWAVISVKQRKYFSRAVYTYMSPSAARHNFPIPGALDFVKIQYHRPVHTYMRWLKEAGFLIRDYHELTTRLKMTKGKPADGNIRLRRSKYRTLAEKRMKELAGAEIPLFLVIGAVKS